MKKLILILVSTLFLASVEAIPFKQDSRNNRDNSFVSTEVINKPHFRAHVGNVFTNNYFVKNTEKLTTNLGSFVNFTSRGYFDTRCVRAHGGRSNGYCGCTQLTSIIPPVVVDNPITGKPPKSPTNLVVTPIYNIPDTGITLSLLSLGLSALVILRRRF